MQRKFWLITLLLVFPVSYEANWLKAQVYTPWVLREDQPDTRDLKRLTENLYAQANARTDREKAEAIWRYLLTDGRHVTPGVFYHIAGWAYEEPLGEVLDPIKLLNSYGFGLCYQVAPLLEALWEAGGFPDTRVWFLEGHTVTEVYFDGRFNMLDSDMLGFTTLGNGDPTRSPIASVNDLENDARIILDKLAAPDRSIPERVPHPWYPADVREKAMDGYAELFTSRKDNWLFPYKRYPEGHSMEWVLRPGERIVRYYRPSAAGLYYLPYKRVNGRFEEFPRELAEWKIRTENGPRSQKDSRLWADGKIEFRPALHRPDYWFSGRASRFNRNLKLPDSPGGNLRAEMPGSPAVAVFEMQSPWVLIGAEFEINVELATAAHRLSVDTSTDGGRSWDSAGSVTGPFSGPWRTGPAVIHTTDHGALTSVSGRYGYLVRLTLNGPGEGTASVRNLRLASLIQHNPRTLPDLNTGPNRLIYTPGQPRIRHSLPIALDRIGQFALSAEGLRFVEEQSNGFLLPDGKAQGELIFEIASENSQPLSALQVGGRFLVLQGLAPEKLTAETRRTTISQDPRSATAKIEWALTKDGPWTPLWEFRFPEAWPDGIAETRLLVWPEVDETVSLEGTGTPKAFVRYHFRGLALDDIRLAALSPASSRETPLLITHRWKENGSERSFHQEVSKPGEILEYQVATGQGQTIENIELVLECPEH